MTSPAATILIVDDEIQNRRLLEALLRPEGYVTLNAANGEEALASIAQQAPDLILLDIMMPGMDGYEVARTLKANSATSNIPIIMVTAQIDHSARLAGLNAGAEDFLTKPVDRAELWLRVRNLLRLKALGDFFQNHSSILERRVAERTAELVSANSTLRASEERYRLLFDASLDGILLTSPDGGILAANAATCRMLGRTEAEITHTGRSGVFDVTDPRLAAALEERSQTGQFVGELTCVRKGGTKFPAEISTSLFKGEDGQLRTCMIVRDITERKAAEAKIQRMTQLYAALSQCNKAIVHCTVEEELFPQICRAAVQFGGMKMAWIARVDAESPMLRSAASFGDDTAYLRDIEISVDANSSFGRGPTGTAIRENQPFWCQDFLNDPATLPWHERGARAGFAASASLPLRREGIVIGAFTLYCGEANAFDESARDLLVEMAMDISFALDNFARESRRVRMEEEIRHYVEQLKIAFMSTVEVATIISEMRDPYTAGHERRVAQVAVAIGAELGFDARRQEGLQVAGHLHDLGKITIPSEILSRPGKLSAIEFQLIQGHAQASYDVLKSVEFPWPVAEVALQHHERMDGSGYPQGLKGDAILLEARIMAVADVIEAMSSYRPYRAELGIAKSLAEIERGRGTLYDPVVADACLKLFREKGYAIPT